MNPNNNLTIELDGKKYFKYDSGWVGDDYLVPPTYLISKLNAALKEQSDHEFDESSNDVKELMEKVNVELKALNHQIAIKYLRKILTLQPTNFNAPSILCRTLREMGKLELALEETNEYRISKNHALLTCRAAVMCDLNMYAEARKEISAVLASGSGKSREYAFQVVNRIKAEAPWIYK